MFIPKSMYQALTFYHNITRWLVVVSLLYALYRACRGCAGRLPFTKTDNAVRHWTATLAHVQLVIGLLLYFQSPVVQYFRAHFREALHTADTAFFGIVHPLLMLTAVVVLTIGSSLARRSPSDPGKFKTMLIWFSVAFLLLFTAIPWPFSPFASRPLFR